MRLILFYLLAFVWLACALAVLALAFAPSLWFAPVKCAHCGTTAVRAVGYRYRNAKLVHWDHPWPSECYQARVESAR